MTRRQTEDMPTEGEERQAVIGQRHGLRCAIDLSAVDNEYVCILPRLPSTRGSPEIDPRWSRFFCFLHIILSAHICKESDKCF